MDRVEFVIANKLPLTAFTPGEATKMASYERKTLTYSSLSKRVVKEIHKAIQEFEIEHWNRPDTLLLGSEAYEHLIMYHTHRYEQLVKPTDFMGMVIIINPDPRQSRMVTVTISDPRRAIEVAWINERTLKQKREAKK